MSDYTCEQHDNRLKIFYKGEEFIEMENRNQLKCKDFLKSYALVFDDIINGEYTGETLEIILKTWNADYKGKRYRHSKKGQLSIYDYFD